MLCPITWLNGLKQKNNNIVQQWEIAGQFPIEQKP